MGHLTAPRLAPPKGGTRAFPHSLALLGAALMVLVGPPLLSLGSGGDTGTQIPGLRLMVPNTPGGGYDITARTMAKNAEDAELNHNIEVFNLPAPAAPSVSPAP